MRGTTVISLIIAIVLALGAMFAARGWLAEQREQLVAAAGGNSKEAPKNLIVVAAKSLNFGERLTPDKLKTIEWPADALPKGGFSEITPVVGTDDDSARFVLESMVEGEPVLANKITIPGQRAKLSTTLAAGMKAVSIRVNDVLGVAGFVLPGDRVDVMLTRRNDAGEAFVDVLLQGVKVLAIDQIADDRKDQPSVVRTVTFEVSTLEAQKLTLAGNVGTLSLALRNAASTEVGTPERVSAIDLSEAEMASSMQQQMEKSQLEAQLATLEEQMRQIGAEVTDRLATVEQSMQDRGDEEPTVVERIVEVPVAPPVPSFSTVGVIHGGNRTEYKVKAGAGN